MKIIIIDDEPKAIETLELIISEFCSNIHIIGTANSAEKARELLISNKPDLIFLDIEMPAENGFDFLKSLQNIDFQIIFVTAYNQYAIQAFKFSAIDYLLKPVKIPEFINAVNRVKTIIQQKQMPDFRALIENIQSQKPVKIVVNTSDSREYINIADIIHIEGDTNYSKFYLTGKRTLLVSKTLKEFEEMLVNHGFYRTHKSSLVNLNFVKRIITKDGLSIEMSDNSIAMLSRRSKDDFLKVMDNFVKK